jgi:CRP-like cAMP-binding protein
MQAAGAGWRLKVADLRRAMEQSPSLHQALLHFAHIFSVQTAHTALANGRANIEERLARWLLMAQDRLHTDQLPLTHEFLAIMLGVRRPGVTVALKLLENDGLVSGTRGVITVLNRDGLKQRANGAYGAPEAEMRRLFG